MERAGREGGRWEAGGRRVKREGKEGVVRVEEVTLNCKTNSLRDATCFVQFNWVIIFD